MMKVFSATADGTVVSLFKILVESSPLEPPLDCDAQSCHVRLVRPTSRLNRFWCFLPSDTNCYLPRFDSTESDRGSGLRQSS